MNTYKETKEPDSKGLLLIRPMINLTTLQKEVGYESGTINLVALLGLFGEAGEVLDEIIIDSCPKSTAVDAAFMDTIKNAVKVAKQIDGWKKAIRDKEYIPNVTVTVLPDCKKEMADQMFYVNALATCLGTNLTELCSIVVNKITTLNLKEPIGHANQ